MSTSLTLVLSVSEDPHHHSSHTLKLISKYRHNIGKTNPRRVWLEFKKILRGDHVAPIINSKYFEGLRVEVDIAWMIWGINVLLLGNFQRDLGVR